MFDVNAKIFCINYCKCIYIIMKKGLILLISVLVFSVVCKEHDFYDIAYQYCERIANKYGSKIKFVDLNAEKKEMKDYQWAHVTYNYLSTTFENPAQRPFGNKEEYFDQWYDNDGSLEQSTLYERTFSSEKTFELKFSESLKSTTTFDFKLMLFDSAGTKFTQQISIDFSSSQTWVKKETETWKVSQTIRMPPNKSQHLRVLLQRDSYEGFWFNSLIQVQGHIGVWFHKKIDINHPTDKQSDKHYLWFIPVEQIVEEMRNDNFYKDNQGRAVFKARGRVEGIRGVKSQIELKEYPIRKESVRTELKFLQ